MSRTRIGATLLTASLIAIPGMARAVRVDYAIDVAVERNDNVTMSPTDPVELTIFRPGIGFSILQESSTWQAEITGRAEYLHYGDDRFDNTVDSALTGRVNWVAIPERLSFTVEDHLTLQPVNTFAPDVPGNRQQVNVFSAGPTLLFNWTPTLRGAAELRYTDSDAEITDEFNSARVSLALRTTKDLDATSRIIANLQGQSVDFDDDVVARDYNRYDAYGRYTRTLANLDFGIDAGYSRIDYRRGGGSRSEPLLRTDVNWRPSPRNQFSLRASSQFSEAATDIASALDTGEAIPGSVPIGVAVVNSSPFEERRLELRHVFTSTRLTTVFEPYYNKLKYVDTDEFDQDGYGLNANANWLIRPRWRLGASVGFDHVDYVQIAREDETRRYAVDLGYDWSRHWGSRIEFSRYERHSTEPGQDASQNIVLLSITYRNR